MTEAPISGQPDLRRYGLIALSVIAGTLAVNSLHPWVGKEISPILLLPTILFGAWYGGLIAGLAATVLNALSAAYFLLPPDYSFKIESRGDWLELSLLAFEGILITWLCESRRHLVAARKSAIQDAQLARYEAQITARALAKANANLKHAVRAFVDHSRESGVAFTQAMLCYSKVAGATPRLAPIKLSALIERATADFAPELNESGGEIQSPARTLFIEGDESQLSIVFHNLIENAIKFRSAEPPRIRISAEQKKGQWFFSVADNGIGIIPARWEEVFSMGVRLHPDTYPGAGMGLPIAKCIIENHGGLMWLNAEAGEGTTVRFTIPSPAD